MVRSMLCPTIEQSRPIALFLWCTKEYADQVWWHQMGTLDLLGMVPHTSDP